MYIRPFSHRKQLGLNQFHANASSVQPVPGSPAPWRRACGQAAEALFSGSPDPAVDSGSKGNRNCWIGILVIYT